MDRVSLIFDRLLRKSRPRKPIISTGLPFIPKRLSQTSISGTSVRPARVSAELSFQVASFLRRGCSLRCFLLRSCFVQGFFLRGCLLRSLLLREAPSFEVASFEVAPFGASSFEVAEVAPFGASSFEVVSCNASSFEVASFESASF